MKILSLMCCAFLFVSCMDQANKTPQDKTSAGTSQKGTYGYDLEFLQKHDTSLTILGTGAAQIIVSPKYQAKVLTSTAQGQMGKSFGWINYKAYDTIVPHINAYGGENRIWIGPEGGPFTIFFKPGTKTDYQNWQTPAAFDSESWTLESRTADSALLSKQMNFTNYSGTTLNLKVKRKITLLSNPAVEGLLQIKPSPEVKAVAYRTENTLTNTGKNAWTKQTGAPCIWLLDMLPTTDQTTVVTPYQNIQSNLPPANTDYYGIVPPERIVYKDNAIFFKADGNKRCKFGVSPKRVKNILGSYDAQHHLLTITLYDIDPKGDYLNQQWKTDVKPYSGDVIQSYNDGPLEDGSRIGETGFYELESASPALFLKPGQIANHTHTVFHFTGPETKLDQIALKTLGVSIQTIKQVFNH